MEEVTNRDDLYSTSGKYKEHNLFIEAGAGAGKTETIINLIVAQLLNNVPPEKIVAITFTNKATEELLNRIASILQEKIDKSTLTQTQKKALMDVKVNLYKMNVSTIHHFCNKILNENCYDAKLSYNSQLLEENDEKKRSDRSYYDWLHSLNTTDYQKIVNSREDALKKLKNTYDSLCKEFDDISVEKQIQFDTKDLINGIKDVYDYLKTYQSDIVFAKAAESFFDAKDSIIDAIKDSKISIDVLISKIKLINRNIKFNNGSTRYTKNEVNSFNDELKSKVENCVSLKDAYNEYLELMGMEQVNEYAINAWEFYKAKRDRYSLCNNQLIYEAYQLIQNKPSVKEKLAQQYDVIFIDEFQDTSKYQNKLIMDLALAIDERKKSEKIMSTSIVVVGDPKQSIYGFNGADIDLFINTQKEFEKCGLRNAKCIYLPENYRSNQYVLEWINDKFKGQTFHNNYNYSDMKLINKIPSSKSSNLLAGVYQQSFGNKTNQFETLAKFISKLVNDKYKIYDKVDDAYQEREIKYSDILVLTTSKTDINKYVIAFNKEGIRSKVSGAFDLCSSIAFNYLYRIITFVLEQENNMRILFDPDFNADIYDTAKIEKIKQDIKEMSSYGKILYVFNHIDLILQEFTDCDKFLLKTVMAQVMENISYDNNVSSIEILEKLDELIHKIAETELELKKDSDAVRIMNVHKAKGLTAQIVIMVNSGGFMDNDACKKVDGKLYLNNLDLYPDEKEKHKNCTNQERLRLEYVAATRAKQVMIFDSEFKALFSDKYGTDYFTGLGNYNNRNALPIVEQPQVCEEFVEQNNQEGQSYSCTKSSMHITSQDSTSKVKDDQLEPTYDESSPSKLEKHVKIDCTEKKKYNRPANNDFGTIFHRAMELYASNRFGNLDDIVNRAIKENEDSIDNSMISEYQKYIKECVEATINLFNDEKIFNQYSVIEPEFKFFVFDDKLYDGKPTLMSGSIDLLLINDDEALIIDYKTDTNTYGYSIADFEGILKKRYQDQLKTYEKVIKKAYKVESVKTKIVWLEEKKGKTIAHFVTID